MDYKYIEQLLEKYWECETTLQEEDILRVFFQQKDLPAHLRSYQPLFECYRKQAGQKLPADFEKRMMDSIGQTEQEEIAHSLPLKTSIRFRPFFRAAGMVGIVLTLSMAVQHSLRPASQDEGRAIFTEQAEDNNVPYIQVSAAPERQSAVASGLPDDTLNLLQITPSNSDETPQKSQTNKGM